MIKPTELHSQAIGAVEVVAFHQVIGQVFKKRAWRTVFPLNARFLCVNKKMLQRYSVSPAALSGRIGRSLGYCSHCGYDTHICM